VEGITQTQAKKKLLRPDMRSSVFWFLPPELLELLELLKLLYSMTHRPRHFASDNNAGISPEVLAALTEGQRRAWLSAYGTWMTIPSWRPKRGW